MKKYVPIGLILLRLIFAFVIVIISLTGNDHKNLLATLIIVGFVGDILDGIIARHLNISTSSLRVLDTNVDRLFWLAVLFSCYQFYPEYLKEKMPLVVAVLGIEFVIYVISLIRFGKTPSPHNLLTKLWGILIAISLWQILFLGYSSIFNLMIVVGFISRIDSLLIYCILKEWHHDIPSFYQAFQLNEGKQIKRFKIFNG